MHYYTDIGMIELNIVHCSSKSQYQHEVLTKIKAILHICINFDFFCCRYHLLWIVLDPLDGMSEISWFTQSFGYPCVTMQSLVKSRYVIKCMTNTI